MAKHIGLGRGLGALIKDGTAGQPPLAPPEKANKVPVANIRKSPWQPRRVFSPEPLAELIESVKERGVLQPLLVRKVADHYELIAGERRLRAAQEAALTEVPVVIMEVSDQQALEIALVENLQRSDLNLIEEAEGYRMLAEKFNMTQEDIAQRVGKARPTITNVMRLLDLPDPVKQLLAERRITPGHAKALLGLEIMREQEKLAERVVAEDMSVRTLERIVARARRPSKKPRAEKTDVPAHHLQTLVEQLQQRFGTQVRITTCKTLSNGKKIPGRLEMEYYSPEELDRIIELLGLTDSF